MKYFIVLLVMAAVMGCNHQAVELSIEVAGEAPDFTLKDQTGNRVSLDELLSTRRYVAIVFFRSADW